VMAKCWLIYLSTVIALTGCSRRPVTDPAGGAGENQPEPAAQASKPTKPLRASRPAKTEPEASNQPREKWINELQGDPDSGVRARAAEALGRSKLKAEAVVPALAKALQDRNDYVRPAAAKALGNWGSDAKPAIPMLLEALGDASARVRQQALR